MTDGTGYQKSLPLVVRAGDVAALFGRSRLLLVLLTTALTTSIGVLDYVAALHLAVGLLYVVPVIYVTWSAGVGAGILLSLVCATIKLASDVASVPGPDAHASILVGNAAIHLIVFLVIVAIASLKDAFGQERALALHDPVTGSANRLMFHEVAERELIRCRRYGHPFTVAFLDLDDFKRINDTQGHRAGDTVLRLVAERIQRCLRATDIAARLGGDEFALLLPETDRASASVVLRKILDGVRSAARPIAPTITASIGAVTCDVLPTSVDEMLEQTDLLMYAIKKRPGKNAVALVYLSDALRQGKEGGKGETPAA